MLLLVSGRTIVLLPDPVHGKEGSGLIAIV